MPRIHQLSHAVITKIAAGEVIERPGSVVKELLENSVDAGSTRINVEVEQGGLELLRVVDDGCGIVPEDLPLAFASHATSKLGSADDLFRIGTLGFRGEALASIGGVAQVTLQSRPGEAPVGAEVACHGGELQAVKPWNGAAGTRLEVRHLFYNTPVRRKFMRTTATELSHISEQFIRIALANPGLHLTLNHNGRKVYEVSRSAELLDRIVLFCGKELRDKLYEVKATAGPAKLRGFIADPSCERGNAKLQYVFLNGRWIRDRSIAHAIQESYRGLLMVGRYAVVFLFIDLPPDAVDVNVHPTKTEVRFRDGSAVYHLVLSSIRDRLRQANHIPQLRVGTPAAPVAPAGNPPPASSGWTLQRPDMALATPLPFDRPAVVTREAPAPAQEAVGPAEDEPPALAEPSPAASAIAAAAAAALPPLPRLMGDKVMQVHDAYLVMETPDGMLVIDQHALHERILFEQLKERLRTGPLEKQRLLIPEPVDLPADQAARALEQKEALAELGLEIEDFGGGTVILQSYPALLGRRSPLDIFSAVVDYLNSKDRAPTREVMLNNILSVMACRAAVKAGDRLTPEEITSLIAQRDLVHDSQHCPHGRPTTLLVSRHELDRQFGRI